MILNKNYYFLAASLPSITLGEPLEMGFAEFRTLVDNNVFGLDMKKIEAIGTYFDIQNMFALWIGNEVTPYGNLSEEDLEEAIVTGDGLPDYVVRYLDRYEKIEDRIANFPRLTFDFFTSEQHRQKGITQDFLEYERSSRLVLTALRAKELGRDIIKELQFEDPEDDLIAQIISQKDAKSYEPPRRWDGLKAFWTANKDNPMDLFQAQAEYRFRRLDRKLGVDIFSIERIIGYMIQLISAEQWLSMDVDKGNKILDSIVKET